MVWEDNIFSQNFSVGGAIFPLIMKGTISVGGHHFSPYREKVKRYIALHLQECNQRLFQINTYC